MKKIKFVLLSFTYGVLILSLMFVFMKFVSIDFRIVLLLSSSLFFLVAYLSANSKLPVISILLVLLPFGLIFNIVVVKELHGLIWFTPFFILAVTTGLILGKKKKIKNAIPAIVFLPVLLFTSFALVPRLLENDLTEIKNTTVESYTIYDMNDTGISSEELSGKVVVLDFFGTWCKPCRLELKELEIISDYFADRDDIVFFVINTNEGGDTKEKMQAFIDANDYPFHFGFDASGELGELFDLHGVPYLFIFDKKGNMRYEHVGYNKGESNFRQGVIELIEGLE